MCTCLRKSSAGRLGSSIKKANILYRHHYIGVYTRATATVDEDSSTLQQAAQVASATAAAISQWNDLEATGNEPLSSSKHLPSTVIVRQSHIRRFHLTKAPAE